MKRAHSLPRIAERFGLELIVLFGSRPRGRARRESDTDMAVLSRPGRSLSAARHMDLAETLARALRAPEGIDLVRLNRASPLLHFEVARRYDDNRKFFDALERYVARRTA
jgi:predicted nucleotidyltransferase